MCISPIKIPNPDWKYAKSSLGLKRDTRSYHDDLFLARHDTEHEYLTVPCGVCCDCIAVKQMYMVQRIQMEAQKNRLFFGTLTYKSDMLPLVLTSTGYEIPFADIRDFQLMIKRLRNDNAFGVPFRFLVVSERGSLKGRPHFHWLVLIDKKYGPDYNSCLNLEKIIHDRTFEYWCRNYGSKRVPDYKPLCEYHESYRRGKLYKNYDLHFVNPSLTPNAESEVAFYVLKYMLKSSNRDIRLQQALRLNLDDVEYESIWSLVRPNCIKSLGFGLNPTFRNGRIMDADVDIISYLRSCVQRTSKEFPYPCYFQPYSGTSFPLARFYKARSDIFTSVDVLDYYYTHADEMNADIIRDCKRSVDNFLRLKDLADSHCHDDEFTNL